MCWPESSFLLDEMSSCNVETVPVLSFCNNFIPVPLPRICGSCARTFLCLAVTSLCHVIQAKGMLEVKRLAVELRV